MGFTEVEKSIRDRLSALEQADLTVRMLPNRSNERGEIEGNGAITISFEKDDLQKPRGTGFDSQDLEMIIALDIRLRNLRDASGGSEVRGAIYQLLLGFKPFGAGEMYCRSYEFVDRTETIWRYESMWAAPTVVMKTEPGLDLIRLRSIFLSEEVNTVAIAEEYPLIEDGG